MDEHLLDNIVEKCRDKGSQSPEALNFAASLKRLGSANPSECVRCLVRCDALLNPNFNGVVEAALDVKWDKLGKDLILEHSKLLIYLFTEHLGYRRKVIVALIEKFIPVGDNSVPGFKDQFDIISQFAQAAICEIATKDTRNVSQFLCSAAEEKLLRKSFGRSRAEFRFLLQNLCCLYCNLPEIEIWPKIITRLVDLDFLLAGKLEREQKCEEIFAFDQETTDEIEMLDGCLSDCMNCIDHVVREPSDATNLKTLYDSLLAAFDSAVLPPLGPPNVPFLWFYLCRFSYGDTKLSDSFLDYLWRKAHEFPRNSAQGRNAIFYMAGLLAHANYIDFDTVRDWLHKWYEYADNYANQVQECLMSTTVHFSSHAIYYAVCEAIFFVVSYRLLEFGKHKAMEVLGLRQLNLDRLANNIHLNPLRFCNETVAQAFADFGRGFNQSVYCRHTIEKNRANYAAKDSYAYFDHFFPFRSVYLKNCRSKVAPYYRAFPLVSDLKLEERKWNKVGLKQSICEDDNIDDFLEPPAITDYGSSPFAVLTMTLDDKMDLS